MSIPLPQSLAALVASSKSLSLRFDRSYDGYDGQNGWKQRQASATQKEGKTDFLERFAKAFRENADAKELYRHVLERRSEALKPLEAHPHTSPSPLIVRIG